MRQIVTIHKTGGPEVLEVSNAEMPAPKPGEVLVENAAIGLNFVDIYHRTGRYPVPLPMILGVEGAGTIIAVGAGVDSLKRGDRVVYAGAPLGAYASHRVLPALRAVCLPDAISFETGAASFIKGLTVDMLFNKVCKVERGTNLLVHGAAGGLGTIICAWAQSIGARVIGVVSTEAKAGIARAAGASDIILGRDADLVAEVAKLTGSGVDVVLDGIGGTTLLKSLNCVRPFGTVVSLGQAGGQITPIAIDQIGAKSASLARPSIIAYTSDNANYAEAGHRVIAKFEEGIASFVGGQFALADIRAAHEALESGQTQGSTLLIPSLI